MQKILAAMRTRNFGRDCWPMHGTFERVGADRQIIWLDAIYSPVPDEFGKVEKAIKYALGVTLLKKREGEAHLKLRATRHSMASVEFYLDGIFSLLTKILK